METTSAKDKGRCFICFGDEEDGTKLLSGVCSCRGTLKENCCLPCAVACAKSKTTDAIESGNFDRKVVEAVRHAWMSCCNCKQNWTGDMLLDMAKELTKFARTGHPNHHGLRIEALRLQLVGSFYCSYRERRVAANTLLSEIDQLQGDAVSASLRHCLLDNMMYAHRELSDIARDIGEPTLAVEHCAKVKAMLGGRCHDKWTLMREDIVMVEARSEMPNVDTVSFMKKNLGLFKEYYELAREMFGHHSNIALNTGIRLSNALQNSDQFVACERQRQINYQMARQLHGEDHQRTISCKNALQAIQKRRCILKYDMESGYEVLDYDEAADQYLLKRLVYATSSGDDLFVMPFLQDLAVRRGAHHMPCHSNDADRDDEEETFSNPAADVVFHRGTPVLCRDLTGAEEHMNGKLGEVTGFDLSTGEYVICLEENAEMLKIKSSNIRIAMELPPRDS